MNEPYGCMLQLYGRYIDEDFMGFGLKTIFFTKNRVKKTALWEQACDIRFRK